MCDRCKWHQYVDDPEYGRHKECVADLLGQSCPMEHHEDREHEGDSAYDRALNAGLHPTEIPVEWKSL